MIAMLKSVKQEKNRIFDDITIFPLVSPNISACASLPNIAQAAIETRKIVIVVATALSIDTNTLATSIFDRTMWIFRYSIQTSLISECN
jgi:hypothetical protein